MQSLLRNQPKNCFGKNERSFRFANRTTGFHYVSKAKPTTVIYNGTEIPKQFVSIKQNNSLQLGHQQRIATGHNFGLKSIPRRNVSTTTAVSQQQQRTKHTSMISALKNTFVMGYLGYYSTTSSPSSSASSPSAPRLPTSGPSSSSSSTSTSSLAEKAKEFFRNTWKGIVQLYHNTLAVRQIKLKEREGKTITRREYRFVKQNKKDILTVVPILLLMKIPILGKLVLLSIVVRFPWILPSTFGFLKPPVPLRRRLEEGEVYKKVVLPRISKSPELNVKSYDQPIAYPLKPETAKNIVSHFDKELNLDKLNNRQLSSLCMSMGLSGWGFESMLRRRILNHLQEMNKEDEMIKRDGLGTLTGDELEEACKERGLLSDLSDEQLKAQLAAWISLPPSVQLKLLIYHCAYVKQDLTLTV